MPLRGKTALVTGSSQGIGLAVAAAFAAAGARVVMTSEQTFEDLSDEAQAVLGSPGATYHGPVDLTAEGAAESLVDWAWQELGGIEVLVNNVGTFREPPFLDIAKADFDRIFTLNVWSAVAVTQAVVRRAAADGRGGRVLFSTSLNGSRSEPAHTLYDASKGAVNALTRQLAIELAPLGWTTAAVAPGLVETPLTDFGLRSDPAARQAVMDQIPIRRIATVEEIAGWYVFLASDAARYATGIVIPVDGGLDAQQMSLRPITESERG